MTEQVPPAERRGGLGRKVWFWGPIAPLLVLDLWSKTAVFSFLRELQPQRSLFGREHFVWKAEPLEFSLVSWQNTGTIWGLGQDLTGVLIAMRCLALVLIVYFAWRLPVRQWGVQLVLGLILAGAIGNLYDNVFMDRGGVRDFLRFGGTLFGWRWRFPAFNVADSCICVGAIALAWILWRADHPVASESPEDSPAA